MRESLNFIAPGKVSIIQENLPELKQNECLIKNQVSLISPGTELALFTGTHVGFKDPDITWAKYPLLPGYSTVGRVEDVNDNPNLKIGDKVMYYGAHSSHGILNTEKDVWAIVPEGISDESLFGRFAQISATVPYLAQGKGKNVLVFGAGMIGNFCAQLFQLDPGRKVIIADISTNRISLATDCGIQLTLNPATDDLAEGILALTDGEGVDVIVEATGVPELVSRSLELINLMGSVYLLGSSRGDVTINAYKYIHRKGVSLVGAHESVLELLEAGKNDMPVRIKLREMIDHIVAGRLKTSGMITHRITPGQAEEYYNHLLNDKDNYLGVVIEWRST